MSYLELKAQASPNLMAGDVDQIMKNLIMTHPRDQVPLVLQQAGVPLSVWCETYDEVELWYSNQIEYAHSLLKNKMNYLPFVLPCLLFCMFPFIVKKMCDAGKKQQELEEDLARLAQTQSAIYRKYNIQVTVARELTSHGAGSDRHMSNQSCGLRFDVLGGPAMAAPPVQVVGGGYGHHPHMGMGVHVGVGTGTSAHMGNGVQMEVASIF